MLVPSILCSLGSNLSYYSFEGWVKIAAESKLAVGPFAMHMSLCFCGIALWLYAAWRLFFCSRVLARRVYGGYSDSTQAASELKPKTWSLFGVYNLTICTQSVHCFAFSGFCLHWLVLVLCPSRSLPSFGLAVLFTPCDGVLVYSINCYDLTLRHSGGVCLLSLTCTRSAALLTRGWYLLTLRPLRGGSYECLKWFTVILLGFAIETPAIVASTIAEIVDKSHTPPALIAFNAIFDVILNMVYASFAAVADMLFYRDLKLRLEGVDLVKRLESIQAVQSASRVQD
jgi:hypothetical protein